jgi:Tfp pilus assembly protein PilO
VTTEGWHLDKKVPITIIVALALQTLGFIYVGTAWKTEIDFRVNNLEQLNNDRKSQEGRIIAVEQQLNYITDSLKRIEAKLESSVGNGQN